MRKNFKILLGFIVVMFVLNMLVSYATENQYTITREMLYTNNLGNDLSKGFLSVLIGTQNTTQYAKDLETKVIPVPTKIETDDYGNMYAYYDLEGFRDNEELKVIIERKVEISTYNEEISVGAETEINAENEIYTKTQEKIDSEDDKIIKKAKELTKKSESDYEKAYEIFKFVNVEMEYDTDSEYANKGSISALETKKGVCEEFATLYAALCRAVKIPTKCIIGYKLEDIGTEELKIINHVWCEIYLKDYGWVPIEPTVVYKLNGKRAPYDKSFCKIEEAIYIPTGVYNYDIANRTMLGLEEEYYEEKINVTGENIVSYKFTDVTSNYDWGKEAINNLYGFNVIKGYDEVTFGPERNISRIEFICMLSRTLKVLNTPQDDKSLPYYYLEYDETHWSKEDYDYLMKCYQMAMPGDIASAGYYNLANVFGDKFDMNRAITRGEVVALMDAFLEASTVSEGIFPDVRNSHKFYTSIIKSYSNDLIKGYPDGTFKPDGNITRAEMAVILHRYLDSKVYVFGGNDV